MPSSPRPSTATASRPTSTAIALVTGGDQGATVTGEEAMLVTAVHNLVSNAVQYSPDGSRVGIGVSVVDGVVEIAVTDQGVGIPDAEKDRVFERFFRVDSARSRNTGGTGLGLSIVKHIVQNHGGDVRVWSHPAAGRRSRCAFPTPTTSPSPHGNPPSPRSLLVTRILIVEDEPSLRRAALVPAEAGGLRDRGRRRWSRRDRRLRPRRSRPRAARPHAARAAGHGGLPRTAVALVGADHHAHRERHRGRHRRRARARRRRLRDEAVLDARAAGPHRAVLRPPRRGRG